MSADKRSVHTDALATLGTIIDETAGRDAIHLAVEPVIAGEQLEPGDTITLRNNAAFSSPLKASLGIVDPFLSQPVKRGQRFWLIVHPRTITSLRHVWEHPAFSNSGQRPQLADSKRWIEHYADSLGLDYDELMQGADDFIDTVDNRYGGTYLVKGGLLAGEVTSEEFWDHYQIVRGKVIPNYKRQNFFSCSC